MSYVVTNSSPPSGYTAQTVMYLTNPAPEYDPADAVIYVEYLGTGQCVFVNFDICASVNHTTQECEVIPSPSSRPPTVLANGTYEGRAELLRKILEELLGLASSGQGGGGTYGVEQPSACYRWALAQNVPNPCVVSTTIRYEVARRAHVRIRVYNALGQVVRVLQDAPVDPGVHEMRWDGRNDSGGRVSSGVYFYKMEAGRYQATRKMLIIN
jgi:hypothetical protein